MCHECSLTKFYVKSSYKNITEGFKGPANLVLVLGKMDVVDLMQDVVPLQRFWSAKLYKPVHATLQRPTTMAPRLAVLTQW
jgi:hypothetical protein